jgi:hypothetical protein
MTVSQQTHSHGLTHGEDVNVGEDEKLKTLDPRPSFFLPTLFSSFLHPVILIVE